MGISKVIYGNTTLIDLTNDTIEAAAMLSGITAHGSDGIQITGSISSKAAASYTPTTVDQIITAGQYLSGNQTIAGDTNLIASNIVQGISIFGVAGTVERPIAMTSEQILAAVQSGWV